VSIKINRQKRKMKLAFVSFIALVFLLFFVTKLLDKKTEVDLERYLLIGKENIFVIYGNKLALRIPEETYIGDKSVDSYVKDGLYSELYQRVNSIFPEEIEGYIVAGKRSKYVLDSEHSVNIPLINKDGKNYILTSGLNEVFLKLFYDEEIKSQRVENIMVDILNANGRSGYAGKVSKKIEDEFAYKSNTGNHQKLTDYTYIIPNNISENQLKELIVLLDEKYIRIEEKGALPTLANVVLILGRETDNLLNTFVYKYNEFDTENYNFLRENGYKNVRRLKADKEIDKSFIEYKTEDYYIAYKMSKLLNIDNLLENNDLENRINVYIK